MKFFLKHILIFGIVFFLAEKSLYFFISNSSNREYDKRLEMILEGKMNKDIVVLGSSRGANNISAKQLENQTGLSSYNLSYRGSNVDFHEFILEAFLEFNRKPKIVLLCIDNGFEFVSEKSLNFRYDRLSPLKKYNYINNTLIERNKKSYFSKFFCSLKVDRSDFSFKKKNVLPVNVMTGHGSKLLKFKSNKNLFFKTKALRYNKASEELGNLKAFETIQDLCSINNIDLYFVFTPSYGNFDISFYNRFKKLIREGEYTVVYDTVSGIYKNEKLFRDSTHMFKNGAELFTTELSTSINQNK
jgi:hypothetical protein